MEIISKDKIDVIEESDFNKFFKDNLDNKIVYRLNFENKDELQEFKKLDESKIDKINVIYN